MDKTEFDKIMSDLNLNCSDEELDDNRKEEDCSASSKDGDFTQTTAATDTPFKFKSSNNAEWESIDDGELLIYTPSSVENQNCVMGYGLDNILIKTISGCEFPKNHDDWTLVYPNIPDKIKQFYFRKYKIVIFTNQAHLNLTNEVDLGNFKLKIENIVKKIGVPIQVFIATGHSIYRKPIIGMWDYLEKKKNGRILIDKRNSYYVGEPVGRNQKWIIGKYNIISCGDHLFALNLNVTFKTPEEHFLNKKTRNDYTLTFNPKNLLPLDNLDVTKFMRKEQEIVVMVGSPGSGKSHFVKNYLKDYGYVNKDPLDSENTYISKIQHYLDQGKSVVIDNTNPDPATRQTYTEIAKKRNIPARCFVMTTSADHAKHNMKFRSLTDLSYGLVKDIDSIINSYTTSYVPPAKEEGFKEILPIEFNFMPKFDNKKHQRLYEMYLVETFNFFCYH